MDEEDSMLFGGERERRASSAGLCCPITGSVRSGGALSSPKSHSPTRDPGRIPTATVQGPPSLPYVSYPAITFERKLCKRESQKSIHPMPTTCCNMAARGAPWQTRKARLMLHLAGDN